MVQEIIWKNEAVSHLEEFQQYIAGHSNIYAKRTVDLIIQKQFIDAVLGNVGSSRLIFIIQTYF